RLPRPLRDPPAGRRPPVSVCANAKCKYHRAGGGCRLFQGSAWQACRRAVKSADPEPAKKGTRK
ncbi:MAG: hypothetical protein IJP66_04335, partial [Kiritimatiellae bacterium]|nr:hypothetical protein [Kiritimatiellia bacterium]